MTQGVFEVSGIYPAALSKEEVVEYAACAESYSSHPISKSLQKAYGKEIDKNRVTEVKEISGKGVTAQVDGRLVDVYKRQLLYRSGGWLEP